MRPASDVRRVFELRRAGHTQTEIAGLTGVSQRTVSRWLANGYEKTISSPMRLTRVSSQLCPEACAHRELACPADYAYLLGQYLGDGTIVRARRGVYRLFISCCAEYPGIIEETRQAIAAVLPSNAVGSRHKPGCIELSCYSKHWPCLFPQHGPGRKHTRRIELEPWQAAVALDDHPDRFLRGLIHSDGCRAINRVRGPNGTRYAYVRYMFSNRSDDIRGLFAEACDRLGIEWRPMNRVTIAVSRRDSVARLETFVGPKH